MPTSLTVAVLTYNRWQELLPKCLNSITAQQFQGTHEEPLLVEYLVVDNHADIPVEATHPWRVIRLPRNVGNIGGQNACFKAATGDRVLFVSDDVRLAPDCIRQMLGWRNSQVGPTILNPDGTIQAIGGLIRWPGYGINCRRPRPLRGAALPNQREVNCDYVPSIVYLMDKALWEKVGRFDEEFPMAYEDVDMGLRLTRRGNKPLCGIGEAYHQANSTLQYTFNDRWRFHVGRIRLLNKHYRSLDRVLRLLAVNSLDYVATQAAKIISWSRRF